MGYVDVMTRAAEFDVGNLGQAHVASRFAPPDTLIGDAGVTVIEIKSGRYSSPEGACASRCEQVFAADYADGRRWTALGISHRRSNLEAPNNCPVIKLDREADTIDRFKKSDAKGARYIQWHTNDRIGCPPPPISVHLRNLRHLRKNLSSDASYQKGLGSFAELLK